MTKTVTRILATAVAAAPLCAIADAGTPATAAKINLTRLETVTVIGEKVNRSLMDTASSVSVLDTNELTRRLGLNTTADVLNTIPNLVTTEPSNLAPAVRGTDGTGPAQGADAFFAGTRPRLNYQIDGRTLSYNESIFSDASVWDAERVEVFRGPQSTLQGRNAIAGAVVMATRKPTFDLEAGLRAIVGEQDTRQLSAYISGPIIDDQLAARLSVDRRSQDSFVDFEPFPGVSDPEEYYSFAARGKLLLQPSALPDFSALLTINHLDAHAPQAAGVKKPYDDYEASFPGMNRFGTRANGGILDLNYALTDDFALQAVISATDLRVTRDALPGDGNVKLDANERVIEPRLSFALLDKRLNGFVGLHHFRNDQDEFIDMFGGGNFDDYTATDAVFGEFTYAIDNRLDLTLGGRYERERRDRDGGVGPFAIDFNETYNEFLPKASIAWRAGDDMTVGFVVARGYNGGAAGFTYDFPFVSYTYDAEYVWNYEFFARSSLWDGKLQLTANVFYNDYKDMQLPFDLNDDPNVWAFVVRNADEAVTYGAEVGARLLAQPGLELYANLGLLDTEITEYAGSGVEGNELPRAPAYSFNMGFSYGFETGLELAMDVRATDTYYSDVINAARGKTDPYWLANAQVGYRFEHVRVFAAVTNLFDSVEPVLLEPGATPADDVATVLQPRTTTVGVEFTY